MSSRPFAADRVPPPPTATLEAARTWLQTVRRNLVIEVGCGVGLHPIRYAGEHPDHSVLAIERTKAKFEKFQGRLLNHPHLKNLLGVHADAAHLLPHLLPDILASQGVQTYFFLYPNPYPKASQKNLRFAHSPFMDFVYASLAPGGRLVFATNMEPYKDELLEHLPRRFAFAKVSCTAVAPFATPRTHFEKKYLARGETCWTVEFTKFE